MFYVEGIIDSIEVEFKGRKLKRFSLMPASQFMITLPDGTKKVLFVDYGNKENACLVTPEKNENDKEVVFCYSQCSSVALTACLNQLKCSRSTVRICVGAKNSEQNDVVTCPNLEDVLEIHLI